jgi:cell division protein FtsW (lipid II flippase)
MGETPNAFRRGRRRWVVTRELVEAVLTLAVLALLVGQSAAFRDPVFIRGAADRYQEAAELSVPISAAAAGTGRVADVCTHFGGWLPESERTSADRAGACTPDSRHRIGATATEQIPASIVSSWTAVQQALAESLASPLKRRQSELAELTSTVAEASAETDVRGAAERLQDETRIYRERYGLEFGKAGPRSVPVDCAWTFLERKYATLTGADAPEAERVLLLVALAALLDGDVARVPAFVSEPTSSADRWTQGDVDAGCSTLGAPWEVVRLGAEIVGKARLSEQNASKSLAMQRLLENAHWYLAVWAVVALFILQIGRRPVYAGRFLMVALLAWAAVGWSSRIGAGWLFDEQLAIAWLMANRWPAGAAVVLALGLLLLSRRKSARIPVPAQAPASAVGYAGFVLFAGLGWWVLLDLSATGHYQSRFLALYQQAYVFACFVLLSVLPTIRLGLAQTTARWLALFVLLTQAGTSGFRRYRPWLVYAGVAVIVLVLAGVIFRNHRQLTSEIFRAWLIFGVSWFFFVRGESSFGTSRNAARGLFALAFIVFVPVLGLMLTDDLGPLLVILYATSVFWGAAVAFAVFDKAGYRPWVGAVTALAAAAAWVYFVTFALLRALPAVSAWVAEVFGFAGPLGRVEERLAAVRNPFIASNDQLAIVTWFQESAPTGGYGFGAVPWCSDTASGCRGVPNQIQSDYIFTALVGVYGMAAALALVVLLALWLTRVVINHRRVTRGVVTFDTPTAAQQAWISWIAVCWVGLTLAQLAITVAGNVGWLPLTGINFPFVSFGLWSLLANTFFLGLAINLPRHA